MNLGATTAGRWFADLWHGWDRFWFRPSDVATLAVIRIATGAMLLYTHLVWSLRLQAFFGPDGWLRPDAVHFVQGDTYGFSYLWWIESPVLLWTVHILALVVFAMLTLGLFSRVVSVLAFIAALSYIQRVPGALFGLDQINAMLAMYLMIGPSGAAYSLDRLWAARRAGHRLPPAEPSVAANVAIRLIQLHMCVIYMFAGMSKLMGPAWWNGYAMWMTVGNYEYQSLDMTWLANWERLVNLLTHVTIFWEIYYCALIWPRRTRPIMLILAVPMHLGIAMCLGMITFGVIMLVGNLAFVSPALVRRVIERTGKKEQPQSSRAGQGAASRRATTQV